MLGSAGRAAVDALDRDQLSGEVSSEQRQKHARGGHMGARVRGHASRKCKARMREPDWSRNAGTSAGWAGEQG